MNNENTLNKIKEIAIEIDHNQAFDGKSKGNQHLFRVVKLAEYLAQKENADVFISIAGAWLHDTALPSGDDYDYEHNKKIIHEILKEIDLDQKERDAIAECVASHEGTTTPQTLEAKIVHDADVLEKVGMLGIIRHTWKLTNSKIIDPQNVHDDDVKKVLNHITWRQSVLQTQTAKELANKLSVDVSNIDKNIIQHISQQAFNGVITEKIAPTLKDFVNEGQYAKLQEQLTQTYLTQN